MPRAMQSIFAWILVVLTLAAAYPLSVWLIAPDGQSPDILTPVLLALALSTGLLTLVLFWEMLIGLRVSLWSAALPYFALMLPGWWLWRRGGARLPSFNLPATLPERILLALLLLLGAGVVFNSVYWPFSREDTIGIYARFGAAMFESRTLVPLAGPLTTYEAYPILIPLTYTYAYLAAGWQNEFLARLFPALMSIGCLGAVFILGQMLRSSAAGWAGAVLLALTPAFSSWASSGYVDLPMAFFYTLGAVFAWRLWQHGRGIDAVLTGLLLGLAAWTKNAGLVGIGLMAGWMLWAKVNQRVTWRHVGLTLGTCVMIAAPWYIRNLAGAGLLIPPTVWVERSSRTVESLLVVASQPQDYSITGLLIVAGVIHTGVELLRQRLHNSGPLLMLMWTVPFHLVWWLFASYDPRFVLLYLPLWCALAGVQWVTWWSRCSIIWQKRLLPPVMLVAAALMLASIYNSVEYKDEILRNPLMSGEERRMIAIRERQPRLYKRWYGDEEANAP